MNRKQVDLAVLAIVCISILEGLNILILRHNGYILSACIAAIAGLAGWKAHAWKDHKDA